MEKRKYIDTKNKQKRELENALKQIYNLGFLAISFS